MENQRRPMWFRAGLLVLLLGLSGCFRSSERDHLRRAEEFTRQNKFNDAIETYRRHIAYRLSLKDRPDWENPYFYLLIIGDLELRQESLDNALSAFSEAEKKGVEAGLVSDRYRSLGTWLEKKGRLTEAIKLLSDFRDRDPLLFDAMLDRMAKDLTAQENATPIATPLE